MPSYELWRQRYGRGFEVEDGGDAELDGMRVIFDQKVGLYPANLQKKTSPTLRRVPVRAAGLGRARRPYAH